MERFYHSARTHKRALLVLFVLFLTGYLFIRPLLPYVPQTFRLAKQFLVSVPADLRSQDGRTNILLLGLGGPKNEPSGLTDTIIFASVDHSGNQMLLLSLPRDIWIPEIAAKLNTAYYYGNRAEGVGLDWARDFVSEITGQPVHYVVVVSFDGFVKIVDVLGGIDIKIEKGFVDRRYPIPGREDDDCDGDPLVACRYETVSFTEGSQHLDGERALKFVRSRHAEGEEGTDFARSARQQKIISSLKKEVLAPRFYLNPVKISQVLEVVSRSVETDIPESHFAPFARLALKVRDASLRSAVLDGVYNGSDNEGLLRNPQISEKYQNQWVLVPQEDSWKKTQAWVTCLLQGGECPVEDFVSAR